MALTLMKRLQMAGNKPIALIGGGTTMIGDPSGRTDMRKMLTMEDIEHNAACFKRQMENFIDFSDGKALMVNNADWLLKLNYVELLREVGACFSVNNMLRAECYKQRMEKGLSFLEFNYMIMQSYDFYALFQKYGCNLQFGGDDQWSNMLGGTELIRRKLGKDAAAMTITLLTDSQGKKMGKTAGNAVWLDPNKTSPFDFYQYWRNVDDSDVLKCIKMLTFLPLDEIEKMESWEGSQLNRAKEILAFELTQMVHGAEEARKAQEAARALFGSGANSENMPTTEITAADLTDGAINILDLMQKAGLIASKGEGRRLVQQGHDVHIAYETSGNIAVGDEEVTRFMHFVNGFNQLFINNSDETIKKMYADIKMFLAAKKPGDMDTADIRTIKGLIRRGEARTACTYNGIPLDHVHFLDLPFYESGKIEKLPMGERDVNIVRDLVQQIKPQQIFVAGDLADPHGTHRKCTDAVLAALDLEKEDKAAWLKDCRVWMYRGAWAEWEIENIEMCVPMSPEELRAKRNSILKHSSQMESAPFLGNDERLFWQRSEDRNHDTAKLYHDLGLACYEAMEAFVEYVP